MSKRIYNNDKVQLEHRRIEEYHSLEIATIVIHKVFDKLVLPSCQLATEVM